MLKEKILLTYQSKIVKNLTGSSLATASVLPLKVPFILSVTSAKLKKSFYRSFNAIFGGVGCTANENITVELLIRICLPTLLYAFEVCPWTKSDTGTLGYDVVSALKKVFNIRTLKKVYLKVDQYST
jgi:hypothetical protein